MLYNVEKVLRAQNMKLIIEVNSNNILRAQIVLSYEPFLLCSWFPLILRLDVFESVEARIEALKGRSEVMACCVKQESAATASTGTDRTRDDRDGDQSGGATIVESHAAVPAWSQHSSASSVDSL